MFAFKNRRNVESKHRKAFVGRGRSLGTRLRLEPLEDRRLLSVYTVDNLDDGVVYAADDLPGSLRQAIFDANTNPGADTIRFAEGLHGTITLASTELHITDSLTIEGPGQTNLTISGNNAVRVLYVDTSVTVEIADLTITQGYYSANGGGIFNYGTLTISNSTISNNSAAWNGGGICNYGGVLTITGSTLSDNQAQKGGGICNYYNGTAAITGSTLSGNSAIWGGGIYNENNSELTVANSTFSNNSANNSGGSLYNIDDSYNIDDNTLSVTDSNFIGNSAVEFGGGIYSFGGILAIASSILSENSAKYGGGIHSESGLLTLTNSTLSDNSATFDGGGVSHNTTFNDTTLVIADSNISNNSAGEDGGGIYFFTYSSSLTLTNTTIIGNSAMDSGGGIYNYCGLLALTDNTIASNSASDGGGVYNSNGMLVLAKSTISSNSATSNGGGIYNVNGPSTFANSTLANNSANGYGGGIYNNSNYDTLTLINITIAGNSAIDHGGGIYNESGTTTALINTIVADNSECDIYGTVTATHSLISDTTDATIYTDYPDSNLKDFEPQLGTLGYYGGTIQTMPLLEGSPAIDRGDSDLALDANGTPLLTDQRGDGFPRVYNGQVDIGAYECQEDYTPPIVVLNFPTFTNNNTPSGSITIVDAGSGVPDGTNAFLDIDLDGDGQFISDEVAIVTAMASAGMAYFTIPSALADGSYDLQVRVSDQADNEGSATATIVIDATPPTPEPSTWDLAPHATGKTSIAMTATLATDPSGVEYYFECLNGGGHSSGWQDSPIYEDTGLLPSTTYEYRVKTRDKFADQNEGSYSAPASATTNSPASFTLTGPANGSYKAGTKINIAWDASHVGVVSTISLCFDSDTIWSGNEHWIEIDLVAAADGNHSYSWDTNGVKPGTYYIAGYLWDGEQQKATYSHLTTPIEITALPAQFSMTAPASGSYEAGAEIPLAWIADNVRPGSKISLCYDTDATWSGNEHWIEVDQVAAADGSGSYQWDTSGMAPGTYYVAGYLWDGDQTATFSHLTTPIQITGQIVPEQKFALNAPVSGSYEAGTEINIQWTADNVRPGSKISLCYDIDATWWGNEHWIEIDDVVAADGSGSYVWNTTGVQPGTYYVAGYLWDGDQTITLSHLTQTIEITAISTPAQTFSLNGPATGVFQAGDQVTIEWTANNVAIDGRVSLCYDTDATWSGNEHWIEIDAVIAADGNCSYVWDTRGVQPGTYYVGGYLWDGNQTATFARLNTPIEITGAPPQAFSLTGPATGVFHAGDTVTIEWTADHVGPGSKISLCYDTDATWSGNEHWIEIDDVAAADGSGSYQWGTSGLAPGTYYLAGYLWDGADTATFSHLTSPITLENAVQKLTIDAVADTPSSTSLLTTEALAPVAAEAQRRLAALYGDDVLDTLANVSLEIADLSDSILGETSGKTICIDRDAAGYGWFVDETPWDDSEFSEIDGNGLTAICDSMAASRADLLTAVMHEMGHKLGLTHDALEDFMDATLLLGVRRTA